MDALPSELNSIILWHVADGAFSVSSWLGARPLSETLHPRLRRLGYRLVNANDPRGYINDDMRIARYDVIDKMTTCASSKLTLGWLALNTYVPFISVHKRLRKILLAHILTLRRLSAVNRAWHAFVAQSWPRIYDAFRCFDSWWTNPTSPLYLPAAPPGAPPRWCEISLVLTAFRPRRGKFWRVEKKKPPNPRPLGTTRYWASELERARNERDAKSWETGRQRENNEIDQREAARQRIRTIIKHLEEERFLALLLARKRHLLGQ